MGAGTRRAELHQRRHRRKKVRKLVARIASVKEGHEKQRLVQKLHRVSPNARPTDADKDR